MTKVIAGTGGLAHAAHREGEWASAPSCRISRTGRPRSSARPGLPKALPKATATAATWICARYELVLAVRSRWLQLFAVVFGVLALAVSGAGYILSGGHGVQDFSRTAVSLVQIRVVAGAAGLAGVRRSRPCSPLAQGRPATTPTPRPARCDRSRPQIGLRSMIGVISAILRVHQ